MESSFKIGKESTPNLYTIYEKYPVEVLEAWGNLSLKRPLGSGIRSSASPLFEEALINEIEKAFKADGLTQADSSTPSGLKGKRAFLQVDDHSKADKVKLAASYAEYIRSKGEQDGFESVAGAQMTKSIPLSLANKVESMIREAAQMIWSADEQSKEPMAKVSVSMLLRKEDV